MRRSRRFLCQRLSARIAKGVSPADGPGYIYHFFDSKFEVKVGRTVDSVRRRKEWDRVCGNPHRKWRKAIWCSNAHRAGKFFQSGIRFILRSIESISHLLLELECRDRPNRVCPTCESDCFSLYNRLFP